MAPPHRPRPPLNANETPLRLGGLACWLRPGRPGEASGNVRLPRLTQQLSTHPPRQPPQSSRAGSSSPLCSLSPPPHSGVTHGNSAQQDQEKRGRAILRASVPSRRPQQHRSRCAGLTAGHQAGLPLAWQVTVCKVYAEIQASGAGPRDTVGQGVVEIEGGGGKW